MSHYFTDNRHLPQNRKEHTFRFLGHDYKFVTDNGVFSKTSIDSGTNLLLETLCANQLGSTVLDMGCGYGVIGIILKHQFTESNLIMVDINERAVDLATINAQSNLVQVDIRISDGYNNVTETLSDIVTNPPIRAGKEVIYQMFEEAYQHLTNQGNLWVVIRKQHGAQSAMNKITEVFGNCKRINRDLGFWILKATRTD